MKNDVIWKIVQYNDVKDVNYYLLTNLTQISRIINRVHPISNEITIGLICNKTTIIKTFKKFKQPNSNKNIISSTLKSLNNV